MTTSQDKSSGEDKPLDETDKKILDTINDLHKRDDPMPSDLTEKTLRRLEEGR